MKEGGYNLELALFGRIIKNLSYKEALYILNLDNYKKSLEEFRKGFMKLSQEDLNMQGPFNEYNIKDQSKIGKHMENISIKAKNENDKNDFSKSDKIIIPFRNDIKDRIIKEKYLEPYFY